MVTIDSALTNAERVLSIAEDETDLNRMTALGAIADSWINIAATLVQATQVNG